MHINVSQKRRGKTVAFVLIAGNEPGISEPKAIRGSEALCRVLIKLFGRVESVKSGAEPSVL